MKIFSLIQSFSVFCYFPQIPYCFDSFKKKVKNADKKINLGL